MGFQLELLIHGNNLYRIYFRSNSTNQRINKSVSKYLKITILQNLKYEIIKS